jgi:LPPG:FO 2-phospho-L-lactate transferase
VSTARRVLALAGGVGGSKLARGLADVLPSQSLTIVINTGDDTEHFGLYVAPDIDTVVYAIAGLNDPARGWGLAQDSWAFMDAIEKLGGPTWFRLGDRDLATKAERTRRLREGATLSVATQAIASALGVQHTIAPMSDQRVRTMLDTDAGRLAFHDYFVRRRCEPRVIGTHFEGATEARPSPTFAAALAADDLDAIVLCPSNPFLSIAPIMAITGVRAAQSARRAPLVAVSPIVAGQAIKGPAARMMQDFGYEASPRGLMQIYGELLDGIVIDSADAHYADTLGAPVLVTQTIMKDRADSDRLAKGVLEFASGLRTTM